MMKRLILTALLIVTASIANAKEPPTAYELITKGKILHKQYDEEWRTLDYFIAWDKTDDIYTCVINRMFENGKNISSARCARHSQETVQ